MPLRTIPRVIACLLGLAVLLAYSVSFAEADTYIFEAGASLKRVDEERLPSDREYEAWATCYFSHIPVTDIPWSEAAFMARASYLKVRGTRGTNSGFGYGNDEDITIQSRTYGVATGLYVPGIPLFIGAEVSSMEGTKARSDYDYSEEYDTTAETIKGTLGIVPVSGMFMGGEFSIARRSDYSGGRNTYSEKKFTGLFKYVIPFGDGMAAGFDLRAVYSNESPYFDIAEDRFYTQHDYDGTLTLYPAPWFGMGFIFGWTNLREEMRHGKTYGARMTLFLGPYIGLSASYSRFRYDNELLWDGEYHKSYRNTVEASVVIRI